MFRRRLGARLAALGVSATLAAGCVTTEPPQVVPQRTTLYPGIPDCASEGWASPTNQNNPVGDAHPTKAAANGGEHTLDLDVALRLAGVENPTINLAREVVREALAGQLAARSLLLPSVNIGGNYRKHNGALLAASGALRNVESQSLYLGAGAGVIGSGTSAVPGVRLFAHLGDAAYEPLAARQRVSVRRGESLAVQNAILLEVAAGYLGLIGAESRLEILRRGETDLTEITRLSVVHAKAGQGRQADAKRAEANLDLLRREILRAEEEIAVANAQLCRLLNIDPSLRLRTPAGSVAALRLIAESADSEELIGEALRSRPEVFARAAAISEAQTRVKQERMRPWLPTVSVGYSYGGFGGNNLAASDFGSMQGRGEFDAVAVWTVQNLGVGNRARVHAATAGVGAALAGYDAITNQIRREVTEALADARAAATQVQTAETSLAAAEEGFKLESERIKQGADWRPIEVLDSFRQLLDSRQELLRATIAFDIAQFRLFVAIGRTPIDNPPR